MEDNEGEIRTHCKDRSPNVPTANMENTSEDKCWVWHNWHDLCQTFISFMVSDSSLNQYMEIGNLHCQDNLEFFCLTCSLLPCYKHHVEDSDHIITNCRPEQCCDFQSRELGSCVRFKHVNSGRGDVFIYLSLPAAHKAESLSDWTLSCSVCRHYSPQGWFICY